MINQIPIIAYHKISERREFGLNVLSPATFRKQIERIADSGFQPITFWDILRNKIPPKPIIITFDDGYNCFFENALPILNEYNFKSVVFIITGYIGKKNRWEPFPNQQNSYHLSADEIRIISEKGHEIGSHTVSHCYLPQLNSVELEKELKSSKQSLELLLKGEVISICYPFGKYSKRVLRASEATGYKFGVGAKNPSCNNINLCLCRRSVYSIDNNTSFQNKLVNNIPSLKERIIQSGAWLSIAGRILLQGNKSPNHISRTR